MICGSSMLAINRSLPPQRARALISMPNTRFRRCAQVMATWRRVGGSSVTQHPRLNEEHLRSKSTCVQ